MEALLFRDTDKETERLNEQLAKKVFWRAYGLLDDSEEISRQGINITSDDDPILKTKIRRALYQSGEDVCTLLLTNMHRGLYGDKVSSEEIRLEVFPGFRPEEVDIQYDKGEILFSLRRDGVIDSPLHLVDAAIADSIVDLFDPSVQEEAA